MRRAGANELRIRLDQAGGLSVGASDHEIQRVRLARRIGQRGGCQAGRGDRVGPRGGERRRGSPGRGNRVGGRQVALPVELKQSRLVGHAVLCRPGNRESGCIERVRPGQGSRRASGGKRAAAAGRINIGRVGPGHVERIAAAVDDQGKCRRASLSEGNGPVAIGGKRVCSRVSESLSGGEIGIVSPA